MRTKCTLLSFILCLVLTVVAVAEPAIPPDGVYAGQADSARSKCHVTVTVEGGKITDVAIDRMFDTAGYMDAARAAIPAAIVAAQSVEVDAVAGASLSSNGIKNAVYNALYGEKTVTVEMPFAQPDVIVVGAGLAGMSAANRAAELGANVLVLEQHSHVGGSNYFSGCSLSGAVTHIQAALGIQDSPEAFHEDMLMLAQGYPINEEMAWLYCNRSGEVIDWLDEDIGIDMEYSAPSGGNHKPALTADRVHYFGPARIADRTEDSASVVGLKKRMDEYVASGKICLALNTLVTGLVNEDGVIKGVVTESGDTFLAKNTILCTGGYTYSPEIKEMLTGVTNSISSGVYMPNAGLGFRFVLDAGGYITAGELTTFTAGGVPATDYQMVYSVNLNAYPGAIWVDVDGNRFIDEMTADAAARSAAWTSAKDNTVWVVVSDTMKIADTALLNGAPDGWAKLDELAQAGNCVYKAASIAELAEQIGTVGLVDTVSKYNAGVAAGEAEFARKDGLIALDAGTFYAIKTVPYTGISTLGGVYVDGALRPLREADASPIDGLYCAGEICGPGNLSGGRAAGGSYNGMAAVFGYIAAENAVADLAK